MGKKGEDWTLRRDGYREGGRKGGRHLLRVEEAPDDGLEADHHSLNQVLPGAEALVHFDPGEGGREGGCIRCTELGDREKRNKNGNKN